MKIFNSLEEIKDIEETVVALGNFDGVHRGHQQIIERTVKSGGSCRAEERGVYFFQSYEDVAEKCASGKKYSVCGREGGDHRISRDRLFVQHSFYAGNHEHVTGAFRTGNPGG